MFRRYGKFTGGIDLPEEKRDTLDEPIHAATGIERLLVPLAPCGEEAARPTVQPGQRVREGERIAAAAADGVVDIFAPCAGRVESITTATTAVGRTLFRMPAIELVELSGEPDLTEAQETFDWRSADVEALRGRLAESHLTTLRRRPRALADWTARARGAKCDTLVVNAMESQPYVTADHRLLVEYGGQVMGGAAILARVIGVERCVLAVDHRRTGDYGHVLAAAGELDIERVALPHKYPIGSDHILLKVLTRRETPCGGTALDIRGAVVDPATCLAVYRWVACGQRLSGRVLTVSGEHIARPANLFAPYGADVHTLVRAARPPFLLGGPMIGVSCGPEAVTGPAVNVILALTTTPMGVPLQCIRCGWCRDHCPAHLNVAVLNDLFELGHIETADHLGALSCVECGVCSYVCPARLPLTERVRALKQMIRRMRGGMPLFHEGADAHSHPETT